MTAAGPSLRTSGRRTTDGRSRRRSLRRAVVALATASLIGGLLAPAAQAATAPQAPGSGGTADLLSLADPLLGSANGGNTYPGAVRPFGMLSWSPTTTRGDQLSAGGANGYADDATRVRGFSLTHVNGAGCFPGASGDLPIMPFAGEVTSSPTADTTDAVYASDFSHADERATPGEYRVGLASGVTADLTATTRAGVGELTFPKGSAANVLFRTSNSLNGSENAETSINPAKRTVSGSVTTGAFCGRRGNGGANNRTTYYRLYFTAVFDRDFSSTGTWVDGALRPGSTSSSGGEGYDTGAARAGRGSGGWVGFDTSQDGAVGVRVGISYVSADGAAANLAAETSPASTVASVAADARADWATALRSVDVTGGTPTQQSAFASAMYHTYQQPNISSDVDGRYLGADRAVHHVAKGQGAQYGTFSGWDQYRAQTQLLALLEPEVAGDFAQSLLNLSTQNGGVWDRWVHVNGATHVMTGDPSAPVLANFYAMGVRNFDVDEAFDSLVHQAETPNAAELSDAGCPGQCVGIRPNLAEYLELGYAPQDECHCWGGAAETLEDSAADFALADWAHRLGRTDVEARLMPRASWWRNTFNPSAAPATATSSGGYSQARNANGQFVTPFDPASQNGFAQGSSATYTWMVQHDVSGLAAALGGRKAAVARLDDFFHEPDATLATGADPLRYDPTNEPGIHTPWLYNALGQPWKTQETVRAYADQVYGTGPTGLPGNDDLGTMSAWYVWASLGMYPQVPSRAEMLLSSPVFTSAVVHRAGGKDLTITAPAASDANRYVRSTTVDGKASTRSWLPESFVNGGGTITTAVGPTPNRAWGTGKGDLPVDHVPAAKNPVPNVTAPCTARAGASCPADLTAQMDTDATGTAGVEVPFGSGLDSGGLTLPTDALPAPGRARLGGHTYLVPPAGGDVPNAITLTGRTLYLAPGRYSALDVIATAVDGDHTTTATVTYSDGTTSSAPLTLTDWAAAAPRHGEDVALSATTRVDRRGVADGVPVHLWHVAFPVDARKRAVSITSGDQRGLKLFAVSGRAA